MDLKVIQGTGPRDDGATPGRGRRDRQGRPVEAELVDSGETGLRPVDLIILGYLLLTGVLILAFPTNVPYWAAHVGLRLAAMVVILRLVPARPRNPVLRFVRDWYPIATFLPFYAELRVLTRIFTPLRYDEVVVAWEAALFGGQPSQTWRMLFPWPWLSEYLHFSYFYYYFVPTTLAMWLYLRGDFARFSRALTATLAVFLACCLLYLLFPVAGPYHFFGHAPATSWPGVFAPLIHGIVQGGSSVGTAFPSSHTAVSVCVWFASWRLCRPAFWLLALIVPALALGTIYGGFHYAIDTLAGAALGAAVAWAAPGIHARLTAFVAHRRTRETPPGFASQGRGRPLE